MPLAGARSRWIDLRESKRHEFVSYRKLLILVSQVVLIAIAYYCAFLLRFDFNPDRPARLLFWRTVGMVVIAMIYFAIPMPPALEVGEP